VAAGRADARDAGSGLRQTAVQRHVRDRLLRDHGGGRRLRRLPGGVPEQVQPLRRLRPAKSAGFKAEEGGVHLRRR